MRSTSHTKVRLLLSAASPVCLWAMFAASAGSTTLELTASILDPRMSTAPIVSTSVSLQGNQALVSFSNPLPDAAAYLHDVSSGSLLHTFEPPSGRGQPYNFGVSLALNEDYALIGASGADAHSRRTTGVGRIGISLRFCHQRVDSHFGAPNASDSRRFGTSVDLDGNRAIIGDWLGNNRAGHAFLFDTQTGSVLKTFENPSPKSEDRFGIRVALSDDLVLIGLHTMTPMETARDRRISLVRAPGSCCRPSTTRALRQTAYLATHSLFRDRSPYWGPVAWRFFRGN